jgi:hypothetical protein
MLKTPDKIKSHSEKYQSASWKNYSILELAAWVNNFLKRATHRSLDTVEGRRKAVKDVIDASNYLSMVESHVQHSQEELMQEIGEDRYNAIVEDLQRSI